MCEPLRVCESFESVTQRIVSLVLSVLRVYLIEGLVLFMDRWEMDYPAIDPSSELLVCDLTGLYICDPTGLYI